MTSKLLATSLTATIAGTLLVASPVRADDDDAFGALSEKEQARIDRGEIVVQVEKTTNALKHFRAVGQIKAPASKVYAAFTDYARYPEIFKLKETQILSRKGNVLNVRAVLGLPWPIGDRWVTNATTLSPETLSFSYRRVEGTVLEYEGTIEVVPKGPKLSQVYYAAKGDPGIPLLPTWLLNRFQESLLPDSIQRVRDFLGTN
ncbi:SRPBCC family protein [bacterium]|nr:SRPBCC family protein [bacterium]